MSWHEEKTAHSLGQLGGASLSNCRELRAEGGQREAWLQPLRKHYFLSKLDCLAGNRCERSGGGASMPAIQQIAGGNFSR
jgi:hypothetical protein